jgi:predicted permease
MANFGLILVCLLLGIILRRTKRLPASAPATLNGFILTISLPAIALLSLHEVALNRHLLFPIGMAWLLFALAVSFFWLVSRLMGWHRRALGALILTGGLGNTSFVGFPLLTALYGAGAIQTGILTDQPGSFFVLSSLGVFTAASLASRSASFGGIIRSLLRFPPFIAMLAALALHPVPYPPALREILEKLSATLIPLALVSVGLQMDLKPALLRQYGTELVTGLLFKLALGPALIALLYVGILGAHGEMIQITLVQAAMAPMITGAILASDYDLEPELANLMVAVGIPLSLVTVPLWAHWLRGV